MRDELELGQIAGTAGRGRLRRPADVRRRGTVRARGPLAADPRVRREGREVLDCEDGRRVPVPPTESLRGLPHTTVPVLCRYGDHHFEDDPLALLRIVHGGYSVALWRRRPDQPDAVCGDFHRRVGDTIAEAGSAERLPEVVHALQLGLRAGLRETHWADGIALFYDDPSQPLPGAGDLLEAP
ncbi:hypothetical protein [Streptomyces sp. NBC_00996]|uniref:VMAP-C domain-containing protein n=1 Tax=Streptomyces sp. NBC_00996 TaxID=2903710 RepID=UPI003864B4ED|nr:hypothetical protein OG390_00125 [Streptomyces sp. NBC_00996]